MPETKKPESGPGFTVTVQHQVKEYDVLCLLGSAFEGGIGYWGGIEGYEYAPGLMPGDFGEGGRHQPKNADGTEDYWHRSQLLALRPGCAVIVEEDEGDDGKSIKHRLDRAKVMDGLQVMAAKYPRHWESFVSDNADATTGDVFIQCCLFHEIKYG